MIIQEHFELNGIDFIRTYSDAGRYVMGGVPYGEYIEATDPAEFRRQYVEGDPLPAEELAVQAVEVLDILTGVSE